MAPLLHFTIYYDENLNDYVTMTIDNKNLIEKMIKVKLLLILLLFCHESQQLWPPEYHILLNDSETFVISDSFDDGYEDIIGDEEMIKEAEIKKYEKVKRDWEKYYRIHQFAARKNRNMDLNFTNIVNMSNYKKFTEKPFEDIEYAAYAGFLNNKKNNFESKIMYYSNEMMKSLIEHRINETKKKRQDSEATKSDANYDYNALKKDYLVEVEKDKKSNKTLKYVTVPQEEKPKDAVKNIFRFKKPKNCTKEEMLGFGLGAVECFMQDMRTIKTYGNAKTFFARLFRVILIWFCIYLIIAIPSWCFRGWCCCCFRCRFCKPRKVINEAKSYFINNPLGVLHNEKNEKIIYKPTPYEKHAQKQLELEILKL